MITYFNISKEFNNKRLYEYLEYYKLSKSRYKDIIFSINNKECDTNIVIKANDILSLEINEEIDYICDKGNLDVLYEDQYLIVVNKPSGMMVHPDDKSKNGCLVNLVASYFKENNIIANVRYLHRIDTDTSGIVIFAKDILTASYFNHLIELHQIKRTYLAIVGGMLSKSEGVINSPIGRDRHNSKKFRVSVSGKPSITHYKKIKSLMGKYTAVELVLETGRTHQIRVHMASINHPLLGDILYGGDNKLIDRQALHSYRLDFYHPFLNQNINIECKIPNDMFSILKK